MRTPLEILRQLVHQTYHSFGSESRVIYDVGCDVCGVHICWCYECDMNGNYMYCDSCYKAAKELK